MSVHFVPFLKTPCWMCHWVPTTWKFSVLCIFSKKPQLNLKNIQKIWSKRQSWICWGRPHVSLQQSTGQTRTLMIYCEWKEKRTFTAVGIQLRAGEDMLQDEGKKSFLEFGIRGVQQWSACRRIPHLKLVIMSYENVTQTHEGLCEKKKKTIK